MRHPEGSGRTPTWKRVVQVALCVLGVLCLITAALPSIPSDRWWVRVWDFPRLQLAGCYAAVAAAILFALPRTGLKWALVGLLAAATLWQGWWALPYLPIYPTQTAAAEAPRPERTLRILAANVLKTNRRYDRLIDLVRRTRPDLVVLTEPDEQWARNLEPLEQDWPHTVEVPSDTTYGMLLLSRLPLVEPRVEYLLEEDVPSIHTLVRLRSGELIRLIAIHPNPPRPGEDTDDRDAELIVTAKLVRDEERAAVVVGDLNDVGWSETTRLFQKISGLLDPRVGRGLYATFPADLPLLRYPLDHLFAAPQFRLVRMGVLESIGSDHLPMWVELSYEPERPAGRAAPPPEPEELDDAEEQIDRALRDDDEPLPEDLEG